MAVQSKDAGVSRTGTRARLLRAAETLFIEHGYEAMSLSQITGRADANLAAVNYHFGSKERLMQELLGRRLDRLNSERLQLLTHCERAHGQSLDAGALLSVLFVPALRLSRPPLGDPSFMRLLGRVYSDPSTFVREYLHEHYRPIFERFFEAFSLALPQLPRGELSMRLRFSLQSLSGVLAGEGLDALVGTLSMGQPIDDTMLLARLIALVLPMLTVALSHPDHSRSVERVAALAEQAAQAAQAARIGAAGKADGRDRWSTAVESWIAMGGDSNAPRC